jgi:hypothetical protein
MAPKIKIAKFGKEPHPWGSQPMERAMAKSSGLYLLELRTHASLKQSELPKGKLVISIETQDGPDNRPVPIKITHT